MEMYTRAELCSCKEPDGAQSGANVFCLNCGKVVKDGTMQKPFEPKVPIPLELLLQSIVSFHLQLIAVCKQKEEAVFHWRQMLYYRDYCEELYGQTLSVEKVYDLCKERYGKDSYIVRAIDKFKLLELED